jgi:hypothetical protein
MKPKTSKAARTARTRSNDAASRKKDPNRYPKGWDARSVAALADHYENQSEDDAVAEHEAAYRSTLVTMMAIPVELVPKVQKLLAKRAG